MTAKLIGIALVPLFWLLALSTALYLTRRFFPRLEAVLFADIFKVLARYIRRIRAGHPSGAGSQR